MECLLQWLDDLDDLLIAAAARWDFLRRSCLAAGLIASLGLSIAGIPQPLAGAAVALAAVAAVSVAIWLAGAWLSIRSQALTRRQAMRGLEIPH